MLRDVYTRVGNGGFGPAYGLIGIEGGAVDDLGQTVEELYDFSVALASPTCLGLGQRRCFRSVTTAAPYIFAFTARAQVLPFMSSNPTFVVTVPGAEYSTCNSEAWQSGSSLGCVTPHSRRTTETFSLNAPELRKFRFDPVFQLRVRSERSIDECGVDAMDGAGNRPRMILVLLCAALFFQAAEVALAALRTREKTRRLNATPACCPCLRSNQGSSCPAEVPVLTFLSLLGLTGQPSNQYRGNDAGPWLLDARFRGHDSVT